MGKVFLISGPTGTGKTQLALYLAKKFNGEVISADSRQIYIGLDYGTNKFGQDIKKWYFNKKIGVWFFDNIPVYLYDLITPDQTFSAYKFVKLTNKLILDIWNRQKLPIVVGGTGFYQRALVVPLDTVGIPANIKLRRQLEKLATFELVNQLKQLNPSRVQEIDLKNRRRLVRAIEVESFSGEKLKYEKTNFDFLWIGLTASRPILFKRTINWINKISKKQLTSETESLIKKGYKNTPILSGIIYGPAVNYLNGLIDFSEYQEQLKGQIKDYIKRQLTWFKKQPEILWFDINQKHTSKKVEKTVQTWLNR